MNAVTRDEFSDLRGARTVRFLLSAMSLVATVRALLKACEGNLTPSAVHRLSSLLLEVADDATAEGFVALSATSASARATALRILEMHQDEWPLALDRIEVNLRVMETLISQALDRRS